MPDVPFRFTSRLTLWYGWLLTYLLLHPAYSFDDRELLERRASFVFSEHRAHSLRNLRHSQNFSGRYTFPHFSTNINQ